MTAPETQTYTVIGLTLDVDRTKLLIAAVVTGAVADQVEPLATSEEDFTRWAAEFTAPDPDTAADLAYAFCRDFGYTVERTAGEYLQRALTEAGIASTSGAFSGCSWLAVATPDGGEILISGQGNHQDKTDYPLNDHTGWFACRYDSEGEESTILYDSHSTDLAVDTAVAVAAVRPRVTTG